MTRVAFVAGASGYTGREVVAALCAVGVRTVAHVRPGSPAVERLGPRFAELGAELDTTPWDEPAMAATLARLAPDAVFALLGTTKSRARQARARGEDASYEAVDYGLTALLRRAAATLARPPRFVYLSAAGAKLGSPGAYGTARAKVEAELRAGTLPYTIARPSFITGSDRDESRPGERLGAGAIDGLLALGKVFGARRSWARYRSTSNAVLAAALVRMAFDPAWQNRVAESEDLRA
ncbi:MAG: NAD(P)H-binding protein [Myxococcales bacterium]|nr:NAD(P)H-binding protein [Myxococcales bacterium]